MTRRIALFIAACMLGLAGFHTAVAEAHTAQVVISCDSVGFNYAKFPNQANTANYSVTVNSGSGSQAGVFSWSGTSFAGSLAVHAVGSSTITASTTWTADGGGSASQTMTLACQAPPTTTTAATAPPTVCPDGLPPKAGHDGQSGNDDCVHTTAVVTTSTTTPTNATPTTPTTLTTTNQATDAITTTPTSGPTGGGSNGTHTASTHTRPQFRGVLAKQVTTSGSRVSAERMTSGQLPFTGFRALIVAFVGSAMLVAGFGIRRLAA